MRGAAASYMDARAAALHRAYGNARDSDDDVDGVTDRFLQDYEQAYARIDRLRGKLARARARIARLEADKAGLLHLHMQSVARIAQLEADLDEADAEIAHYKSAAAAPRRPPP